MMEPVHTTTISERQTVAELPAHLRFGYWLLEGSQGDTFRTFYSTVEYDLFRIRLKERLSIVLRWFAIYVLILLVLSGFAALAFLLQIGIVWIPLLLALSTIGPFLMHGPGGLSGAYNNDYDYETIHEEEAETLAVIANDIDELLDSY